MPTANEKDTRIGVAVMTVLNSPRWEMGVVGGILGICLGCAISVAISHLGEFKTVITATPILVSFSFAVGIGLFFGIYPARKAAKLDPIDALRYE